MKSYYERSIAGFPSARDSWIRTRFDRKCAECEQDISEGEMCLYSHEEMKSYCAECGDEIKPRG